MAIYTSRKEGNAIHSQRNCLYLITISSTSTATGNTNYDRPSRLKGREEGGIKWSELLEKFRAVQDKARRMQRQNTDGIDSVSAGLGELRIGDGTSERPTKDGRSSMPSSTTQRETISNAAMPPKKSGLGRQFGRLGGAVSGKGRRAV